MKNRKIALSDVAYLHRDRPLGNIAVLADSIKENGLRQPIVLHCDGHTLVSGLRRFHACQQVGMEEVACLIPSDVIEAASALQKEISSADAATELSMSLRERMDLVHQLHSFPVPSAGVAHGVYAAEVAGIPNRSYWRIRSVMNLAKEGEPNPSFSAIRARKIAGMMLAAIENPPEAWAPTRIIEELHKLRERGDIPESLEAMQPSARASRDAEDRGPKKEANCSPKPNSPRAIGAPLLAPRRAPDIGRVLSSLSGVCAGIPSITEIDSSSGEDLAHWNRELRDCKKIINGLHALVRKAIDV